MKPVRHTKGHSPAERLVELGIKLPEAPRPIGNFVPYRVENTILYLSGQGPLLEDGTMARGKVGAEITTAQAYEHARRTGLVLLSVIRDTLGDLDRVEGILKLFGMVNAIPEFEEHPEVINGCSDLLVQVFGPGALHTRSAVGVGSLPRGISVEIEAVVILNA